MQPHARQVKPGAGVRRSQRVYVKVAVHVSGRSKENATFQEQTHTLVVNAFGALLNLATRVEPGQKLLLKNKATGEEQECKVVHVSQGRADIGIEFTRPAPQFWQIVFPPEDWKPPLD